MKKLVKFLWVPLLLLGGCTDLSDGVGPTTNYDYFSVISFSAEDELNVGFSDYRVDSASFFELDYSYVHLPSRHSIEDDALEVQYNNKNGRLFHYFLAEVEGLNPGKSYNVFFDLDMKHQIEQDYTQEDLRDKSVYFRFGVYNYKPWVEKINLTDSLGNAYEEFSLHLDKGDKEEDGEDMLYVNKVALASNYVLNKRIFRINNRQHVYYDVQADQQGKLWVVFGADSELTMRQSTSYIGMTIFYDEK
ncbi:hypothetical protein AAG747_13260 [Rapidithrix thailandica]|uniref:Uncharacterized protein n=1 Tax=Rapidithrix thailandica TaxID=413964 RepID=A0AAW9S955_9BACT